MSSGRPLTFNIQRNNFLTAKILRYTRKWRHLPFLVYFLLLYVFGIADCLREAHAPCRRYGLAQLFPAVPLGTVQWMTTFDFCYLLARSFLCAHPCNANFEQKIVINKTLRSVLSGWSPVLSWLPPDLRCMVEKKKLVFVRDLLVSHLPPMYKIF